MNQYKLYQKRFLTAFCGVALITSLCACTPTTEAKTENNTPENQIESVVPEETTQNQQTESVTPEETTQNQQTESDSAATEAIQLMLEGGAALKDSASEAVNSEAFQEELARALQNFKDLSDFIFNGAEINGVTFDDLTEEGKEYARNALNSLDEILESLVPNYKERFKEWFLDTTADGLDALSDLRDEGLELWDEIQSRRNSRW